MNVLKNFQSRGYGELMRLASIVHMKENNLSKNNIEALAQAIPFHYKYGFRPNFANTESFKDINAKIDKGGGLSEFELTKNALLYLSQNKGLSYHSQGESRILLDNLIKNRELDNNELKQLDILMNEYIEKNLQSWNKDLMVDDIPMSLTMDRIEENSSFYNELFEKHAIDYGI